MLKKSKQFADYYHAGFISDSTFKFLFEDINCTLKYVTKHNLQRNIRLHRGFTAAQIVDLAMLNMVGIKEMPETANLSIQYTVVLSQLP